MNTIVSVSMWKAILGEKPETLNQVHKFWLNEYPAGGEEIKVIPVIMPVVPVQMLVLFSILRTVV